MITKNDCLSILVKLEDSGIAEAGTYIKRLIIAKAINRCLEIYCAAKRF